MTLKKTSGIIFNTQKFSIHDGAGIRTLIFMKGCPLRCIWCSNPESQIAGLEVMDVRSNCVGCGKCVVLCEQNAVDPVSFVIDRKACSKCGRCVEKCYANAKKLIGREVSVKELMAIIEKDRIFYSNSGGGVTIGGGEPVMQHAFVEELLYACQSSNIHTAIETCGYGKWEDIKGVFAYVDQAFFDLKAMDSDLHQKLTGVENQVILENAQHVASICGEVVFRIPLIPGYNDSEENIRKTGDFVRELYKYNENISMEILAYHDFGKDKYQWMNTEYKLADLKKPTPERIDKCKNLLRKQNCKVI